MSIFIYIYIYIDESGRSGKEMMNEHSFAVEKRDEKFHIYKHRRETRRHMLNYALVKVLAT